MTDSDSDGSSTPFPRRKLRRGVVTATVGVDADATTAATAVRLPRFGVGSAMTGSSGTCFFADTAEATLVVLGVFNSTTGATGDFDLDLGATAVFFFMVDVAEVAVGGRGGISGVLTVNGIDTSSCCCFGGDCGCGTARDRRLRVAGRGGKEASDSGSGGCILGNSSASDDEEVADSLFAVRLILPVV